MKLTVFKYCDAQLDESQIFSGGDPARVRDIPFCFYLLEEAGRRILIDTGCDDMEGFVMKRFERPVDLLRAYGLKTEDITDVIITHAHHDHIAGVQYFPHTPIYINEKELTDGAPYLSGCTGVRPFSDHLRIGSAECLCIGGHAPGSCIVKIVHDGQTVICAGDECYARDCLTLKIPTGASFCPEKSRAFVEEYSKPEYRVLLCHEPDILPGGCGWQRIL